MSDTDSYEERDVKSEQQIQSKVKDLLRKGQQITPYYDEETLYAIYKDCFFTDVVFLNKLQIIERTRKQKAEEGDSGWITQKSSQNNSQKSNANRQSFELKVRYNFLEDEKLIDRVLKKRQKLPYRLAGQEKHDDKSHNNQHHHEHKQKHYEYKEKHYQKRSKEFHTKEESTSDSHHQKHKYVAKSEKQAENGVSKPIQSSSEGKNTTTTIQAAKKDDSKGIISEIKQSTSNQIKNTIVETTKIVKDSKVQSSTNATKEAKTLVKGQIKVEVTKTEQKSIKPQEQVKLVQKKKAQQIKVSEVKGKIQIKEVKVESKPSQAIKYQPKVTTTTRVQTIKIERPKPVAKQLDPQVLKQFNNSCSQNSFILKFIRPSQRLQKVSYIREPGGKYKEVKTRELITKY